MKGDERLPGEEHVRLPGKERESERERRPSTNSGCGRGDRRAVCQSLGAAMFERHLEGKVALEVPGAPETCEIAHTVCLPLLGVWGLGFESL